MGILDGKSRPSTNFEVQVAGMLAESLGVDRSEVELALVRFSNGLEVLGEGLALLGSFGEDVGKRDAGLEKKSAEFRGSTRR